jgi:O-phospho-L-seryl-tRNASec:L-selenocysteinyl-tRNA synthase
VVAPGKQQQVAGITFQNYGSHCSDYPHAYLTAAAAVGTSEGEAREFAARLSKALAEHSKGRHK